MAKLLHRIHVMIDKSNDYQDNLIVAKHSESTDYRILDLEWFSWETRRIFQVSDTEVKTE